MELLLTLLGWNRVVCWVVRIVIMDYGLVGLL